jgi:glycosyltransferase involved in cell wall biosynthesis
MHGPLISIIIPAYNAGRTLGAAILGVVNQRYENWELLVVDDGSTEDLSPEIEQFGDRRIRHIRLPQNSGLAAALNTGLDEARGRYIARMDADDVMEPWRLDEQLQFLMIEGLSFCGTAARKFGVESGVITLPATGDEIVDSFFTGNPFVHPTILFDRQKVGSELRYDTAFRCEEDYELWSRIVTRSNCGNLWRPTIKYRVTLANNANDPTKRRLNRLALDRFAARMGIRNDAPTADLNEFQMSGFVDQSAFRRLRVYAARAQEAGWPRLGFIHDPLVQHERYEGFFSWLMDHQKQSVQLSAPADHWSEWQALT